LIQNIKACTFKNIRSIKHQPNLAINLDLNPITCDCDVFFLSQHRGFNVTLTCDKPEKKIIDNYNKKCKFQAMEAACVKNSDVNRSFVPIGVIIGVCLFVVGLTGAIALYCCYSKKKPELSHELSDAEKPLIQLIQPLNVETLNLSNQKPKLTSITKNLFNGYDASAIKWLSLHGNQINAIAWDTFNELRNLEHLDLSDNKLVTVENKLFKQLENLKKLLLQKNHISAFEPNAFNGLKKLEELNLLSNKFETIDDDLFAGLTALTSLHVFKAMNMSNRNLVEIDVSFLKIYGSLEKLDLSQNKILSIPANAFSHLKELQYLHLENNEIHMIDENAFSGLVSLTYLNISNNNIDASELPLTVFSGLYSLYELWLDIKSADGRVDGRLIEELSNLTTVNGTERQISTTHIGFIV
jgi:Leucine-rich repeat (LRR) protein